MNIDEYVVIRCTCHEARRNSVTLSPTELGCVNIYLAQILYDDEDDGDEARGNCKSVRFIWQHADRQRNVTRRDKSSERIHT